MKNFYFLIKLLIECLSNAAFRKLTLKFVIS